MHKAGDIYSKEGSSSELKADLKICFHIIAAEISSASAAATRLADFSVNRMRMPKDAFSLQSKKLVLDHGIELEGMNINYQSIIFKYISI